MIHNLDVGGFYIIVHLLAPMIDEHEVRFEDAGRSYHYQCGDVNSKDHYFICSQDQMPVHRRKKNNGVCLEHVVSERA
jgi:hypothetical protein